MSLEQAIKEARRNPIVPMGRTSIGRCAAVLTSGYRTFIGWNSYRSHPLQARFSTKVGEPYKIYIHAETAAIVRFLRELSSQELPDYKLYVARVLKDGTPANARPCVGCQSMIAEFNIKEVYYT